MKKRLLIPIIIVILTGVNYRTAKGHPDSTKLKYIFYFIGDGLSLPQITLTELYLTQLNETDEFRQLNQSKMNKHGLVYTYAFDRIITGSAAAATALSTGNKTSINTISMSEDHTKDLKSVSYDLKDRGMKIGIISTVSMDHATPAAFYANAQHRDSLYLIGSQLKDCNFDLFAGGGFMFPQGMSRNRSDLYQLTENSGIDIIRENNKFIEASSEDLPIYYVHERLVNYSSMPYSIDKKENDLSLADITLKSIELLDNDQGFFIMIEGGKIDWSCHNNDAGSMISDVIDFDNAVGEALKFYEKHPNETLIIVVGDHETGGLSIGNSDLQFELNLSILKHQKMSLEELLNAFRPLFEKETSYEEAFQFIEDKLELGGRVKLNNQDYDKLKNAWDNYANSKEESVRTRFGLAHRFLMTALAVLNNKAGIGWSSNVHTSLPVIIHAHGVGEENFNGIIDNTEIPKIIRRLSKVELDVL